MLHGLGLRSTRGLEGLVTEYTKELPDGTTLPATGAWVCGIGVNVMLDSGPLAVVGLDEHRVLVGNEKIVWLVDRTTAKAYGCYERPGEDDASMR